MSIISASFLNELACKLKLGNSLLSQILTTLTSTTEVDGIECDNTTSSTSVSQVVQNIPHPDYVQKVQICSSSIKDAEKVCISNDGGVTVVVGWEILTITASGIVTSQIYFNGTDVTGTYFVVPCNKYSKYDYEEKITCVDGKGWTEVNVYDKISTAPIYVTTIWLDENKSPQPTPDPLLVNNANCQVVASTNLNISSAYGNDLSTLLPGNTFEISRTSCCKEDVTVVTSIGSFIFPSFKSSISLADTKISFTIDDLITTCDKSSIFIIGQKTI